MKAWAGKEDCYWIRIEQEDAHDAWVTEFYVRPEHRGSGMGRQLMEDTCMDADIDQVTLWLEVRPFTEYNEDKDEMDEPGPGMKELKAFYKSFGFVKVANPIVSNCFKREPK